MKRFLLLVLALSWGGTAYAGSRPAPQPVRMELLDRGSGQALPQYAHRGQRWVAGTPRQRYAVRLTNTSGRRVLVVLSVDGVNALTGQTASPAQGGYVLDPWESTEVTGWRKSLGEVAQFHFTDLGNSYAARTGRPDNVGVVGIAVFEEAAAARPPVVSPRITRDAAPSPGAAPPPAAARTDAIRAERAMESQRIGTGHGAREWAPVSQTTFRRASSRPVQVSELRYDDTRRLVAMGIIPRHPRGPHPAHAPQAFPTGFVPDPPHGY